MNWTFLFLFFSFLGLIILVPFYFNRLGYHWTKGCIKALDESSKNKIKRFRAIIKPIKKG